MKENKYRRVDTLDYSDNKIEYLLQIGGLSSKNDEEVRSEITRTCQMVFKDFMNNNEYYFMEEYLFISVPIQVIPDLVRRLVAKNVAIYSILPVLDNTINPQ